ncbi:MAG: gfo/Idh/MocA family oxidoreductase [Candidatus Hydrothermarchaeota archaeon]|nr:MAG: gfo/Idh/MocA family oxidoreductase [Candidatus Hydrothermarchaeota archaeon]
MVRVGVIGIGNMGRNHVRVYSELERAELVAIADINREFEAIAHKYKCRFYTDYNEMLESEEIDAVSIAVPTSLHKKVAMDCITKGKHVLIEKPIASSVEDARAIIKEAKKKNIILMVGHIERFNPAVKKLKEIIKRGELGEIISIVAKRVGVFPPQIKDANVILDLAIHDIDIFNYLLNALPTDVLSFSGKALNKDREDHAMLLLKYNSTLCLAQVNWITPVKIRELAVTGTKGYAELNYITQELNIYQSIYERGYDSFGDFIIKFGKSRKREIDVRKEEPLKLELLHFIECIENKTMPTITGEEALAVLEIIERAMGKKNENR